MGLLLCVGVMLLAANDGRCTFMVSLPFQRHGVNGRNDRTQVMSLCRLGVLKIAASKFQACKFQLSNIQTLDVGKYSYWAWQALIA
jgi:hypothetical protein